MVFRLHKINNDYVIILVEMTDLRFMRTQLEYVSVYEPNTDSILIFYL